VQVSIIATEIKHIKESVYVVLVTLLVLWVIFKVLSLSLVFPVSFTDVSVPSYSQ
jgi:hypothetical protein